MTPDVSLHGAKGYREVAKNILKLIPTNSIIGAFQSGAFMFYAQTNYNVVNLDGVVDPIALNYLKQRKLGEYAKKRNVIYFVDWQFNYIAFRYFGGEAIKNATFKIIGYGPPQGPDRMIISKIKWRN